MSPGKPQDGQNKAREAPGERHLGFQGPRETPSACVRNADSTENLLFFRGFSHSGRPGVGGRGVGGMVNPPPNDRF